MRWGQAHPSFSLGAWMSGSVIFKMAFTENRAGLVSKVMVPFEHTKFEVPRRNPDRVIQLRGGYTNRKLTDDWQCMVAN